MYKNEKGFSVIEVMISLVVGVMFLLAFYQLYNATYRLAQESLERAYAYNMASRYLDEGRYWAASEDMYFDSNSYEVPYRYQPGARGEYHLMVTTEDVTPTLEKFKVVVTYGPDDDRKQVKLNAFIRYDGGIYY